MLRASLVGSLLLSASVLLVTGCSRDAAAPSATSSSASAASVPATPRPTGAATGSAAGATGLAVGDLAPDFSLPGSDGKVHKLSEHRGKEAVVVAWFPKAFTGG